MPGSIPEDDVTRQATDAAPPSLWRSVDRPLQMIRHYRTDQVLRRLWRIAIASRLPSRPLSAPRSATLRPAALAPLASAHEAITVGEPTRLAGAPADIAQGRLTFLGQPRELGWPLDWTGRPPQGDHERLWQFQLHYQEFLMPLAATAEGRDLIGQILRHWVLTHPQHSAAESPDAWHPYCISRRLPVWLRLLAALEWEPDVASKLLRSCALQAEFLSRNLERELGGNHLLENATALAIAGASLQVDLEGLPDRQNDWIALAEQTYTNEMSRQLLPHGEHFERSPMYHVHVLANLYQTAAIVDAARPGFARKCRDWAGAMWAFLQGILHPDGEIPLFSDSCFGETYSIAQLTRLRELTVLSGAPPNPREGDSDLSGHNPYWTAREDDHAWIVDSGPAAPDELPAHGHCDLGGFEASIAGQRWIVDGGLYGYGDDPMRKYCRSSVAHNVATVDNRNQIDVWSRFRMGRRVSPTTIARETGGDFSWIQFAHHGYRPLGIGPVHRVAAAFPGHWMCVDCVPESKGRRVTGRLRLAPHVQAVQRGPNAWTLTVGKTSCELQFYGAIEVRRSPGWYAPRFGERIKIDVLEYTTDVPENALMGWVLALPGQNGVPSLELAPADAKAPHAGIRDSVGAIQHAWQFCLLTARGG